MKTKIELKSSLFVAIHYLLYLSLAVIVGGCAPSKYIAKEEEQYTPEVIDVDNFDPADFFERATNELEARKKTRVITCYLIGNANVRFVQAADSEQDMEVPLAYDSVSDIKGRQRYITRITAIDRDDVELLYIERSSYKGKVRYVVGFLFQRASWDKVHAITEGLQGKKLALIRDNKVIATSIVDNPLFDGAQVPGDFTKLDIEWITGGLPQITAPDEESRKEAHTSWLEKRVGQYSADTHSLTDLAWDYYSRKESACEKAGPIYEKVIRLDPERYVIPFLQSLSSCYKRRGNYEQAITFLNQLLVERKTANLEQVYISMALAEAYSDTGKTQKAFDELKSALSASKSLSLSYPWLNKSGRKDEIENQFNNNKAQMIETLEEAMAKLESEGLK
jgi:hypothetical protein